MSDDDLDYREIEMPPPPGGRPGLTREQTFVLDRIHNLIAVGQEFEALTQTPEIARVMKRCRYLRDETLRLLDWKDFDQANKCCQMLEAALKELRHAR